MEDEKGLKYSLFSNRNIFTFIFRKELASEKFCSKNNYETITK